MGPINKKPNKTDDSNKSHNAISRQKPTKTVESSFSRITNSVTWTPPHRKLTLAAAKHHFHRHSFIPPILDSIFFFFSSKSSTPFNSSLRKKLHMVILHLLLNFENRWKRNENSLMLFLCVFSGKEEQRALLIVSNSQKNDS